ncbi:MAG: entericidin A/B family lipoprotein [Desulfuromonadales bacterium]|nr:entericidin A/B family lipoprotein [Desulfuromonadales bacterium]
MKKVLVVLVMGMMMFSLSACETMKGLGQDIEDGGEWVQEKAS